MNVGEKISSYFEKNSSAKPSKVTVADDGGAALRPSEGEDVFSEEAVVPTGSSVEEPDLEERCDEVYIQVVIEN